MTIEENVSLAPLTTFKIGGPARFLCRIGSLKDLEEAFDFARKNKLKYFIIGGGSNLLISDLGFDGLVIKNDILGIDFVEDKNATRVIAGAGESWDYLVSLTVEKELHGLENLSGVPGTVGGAVVQNLGAYGSEVKDCIESVEVFDSVAGKVRVLSKKECKFAYRDSIFKTEKGKSLVAIRATFSLLRKGKANLSYKDLAGRFIERKTEPSLSEIREAVLAIRAKKFPDLGKVGTAGSFFKNPVLTKAEAKALINKYPNLPHYKDVGGNVKVSLAWIIDKVCGLKEMNIGGALVSSHQALSITNVGNASEKDVTQLAKKISKIVFEKTGIEIEMEVCRL